ncbi:GH25 family lysozyme M1 (1,4-beta-N-acetylmuramidase) [Pseudaminobacter salicylatoxidans]|uniref:GH25 family lysozyme M1 (1,4-beta-N-acetylmuramidase) n=2 Tax=Pseudaminobacter salicylatoxidans TaxID=93369 RepID=A0A316C7F5_PSESE|nr:GH25 family lysozyme [Pseudaminobacter salicylatoxidans]PWJ85448.1 GH25 family lysozyme M1 (1,4-beta-N-acetylmuramidase) [Pseudaminobacter salicylatoxidans]
MPAGASDFSQPWKKQDRALVIDAYEYNPIDWDKLTTDKTIVGFINKASDGLAPPYSCSGNETEIRLCKALWKRHAVARELYQTRRAMAKTLGLKWGAYHLARPGNPIDQANNFIDFADPAPDDLIALDIEDNDPEKWMSLEDAEEFVRHIQRRTGRYPILYTNGSTAQHIADNRDKYPLLSRLPLWYARYKPEIDMHFPKGNWETYALWQFVAQANCNARSCPYRVPGTPIDIDVNVAAMNADELRKAWPFGNLLEEPEPLIANVPLPTSRETALALNEQEATSNDTPTLAYAPAPQTGPLAALESALINGKHAPLPPPQPVATTTSVALAKVIEPGDAATPVKLAEPVEIAEASAVIEPAVIKSAGPVVVADAVSVSSSGNGVLGRIGSYLASLRQAVANWAFGGAEASENDATLPGKTELP